jgi:vacuolar-type H+-ATPase subunit H
MNRSSTRAIAGAALAAVVILLAASCAEYSIERDGKDAGEALCDLKNADNQDEAQQALDDAEQSLEDALDTAGRPVSEDVADVEENLQDLVTHASEGNEALLDQDIATIRRNVEAVVSNSSGAAERFYQGVIQGLGDCSD